MRLVLLCCAAALLPAELCQAAGPSRKTIELALDGKRVEGTPLAWSKSNVLLLARDGRLWDFAPSRAADFRQTSSGFVSYSANVMRQRLQQELGSGFEISGTGHYLVAHPRGGRETWSRGFDELYRNFQVYFNVRGFRLARPEFPLVAIVFPNRHEFTRYALRDGADINASVLGYYSPTTNRIAMYDTGEGTADAFSVQLNNETIIHEATHQIAFNTGIHNRFAPQPRWIVEGLGTLFEARGVWDSRAYPSRSDRINRHRLSEFKQYAAQRSAESLARLVSSDGPFNSQPNVAYADAWALTFYLCETQPRKYADLLERVAAREPFEPYGAAARLRDFTSVFGDNFRLLHAQFERFMETLQ